MRPTWLAVEGLSAGLVALSVAAGGPDRPGRGRPHGSTGRDRHAVAHASLDRLLRPALRAVAESERRADRNQGERSCRHLGG
jgi:hypothetical protein